MSKPERQNDNGFYVYCIADTEAAQAIAANDLPSPIEENARLELIARQDQLRLPVSFRFHRTAKRL